MTIPTCSIVVPVYRSEKTLGPLYERIKDVFDDELKSSFELVLIDDGSQDGSWEKMLELHQQDQRVKIVQLAGNFGQHNALICGFSHARGEFVVTMDDDLQHPPEEIPKLIQAMETHPNADVVIGSYREKKHSRMRNLGTRAMNWFISKIFGKEPDLQLGSFRLMRAVIVEAMLQTRMEKPRVGILILQLSNRIVNTTVDHDPRKFGESGYTFKRLTKDFVGNILSNSALPLHIVSYLGFASSILSLILTFVYLYRYFFVGISVPGWTTLVLLTLFYFGILLFSIGIIGEYLIKILKESRRMPRYVVRDKKL